MQLSHYVYEIEYVLSTSNDLGLCYSDGGQYLAILCCHTALVKLNNYLKDGLVMSIRRIPQFTRRIILTDDFN